MRQKKPRPPRPSWIKLSLSRILPASCYDDNEVKSDLLSASDITNKLLVNRGEPSIEICSYKETKKWFEAAHQLDSRIFHCRDEQYRPINFLDFACPYGSYIFFCMLKNPGDRRLRLFAFTEYYHNSLLREIIASDLARMIKNIPCPDQPYLEWRLQALKSTKVDRVQKTKELFQMLPISDKIQFHEKLNTGFICDGEIMPRSYGLDINQLAFQYIEKEDVVPLIESLFVTELF